MSKGKRIKSVIAVGRPILRKAIDGTLHAFPAGTPETDIERYQWRYENGQTLPEFAFSPAYEKAREYFGRKAFQPEREEPRAPSRRVVRITARRGLTLPPKPARPRETPEEVARKAALAECLKTGRGCKFDVAKNDKANKEPAWYEFSRFGESAVRKHNGEIEAVAKKKGIDPDLIRSVMYTENARGNYGFLGYALDSLGMSKSIMPMNVNEKYWGKTWGTREQLETPMGNIMGGAEYLRRLKQLYPKASIEQLATLYNSHTARKVNDYGARVGEVYKTKPWTGPDPDAWVVSGFRNMPLW